ncbi:MAG: CHAT domain-containing protein [Myxococcota bacterium]
MDRSTRQALLAEVWNAEGIEALLSLLARSRVVRDHQIIHELHEQSLECERTAPEVSNQLQRVAGLLAELHAGLRAAEVIDDLSGWLTWQAEVSWRQSAAMHELLARVAASVDDPAQWPWRLERLPSLQAELDRLLGAVRALTDVPPAERPARVEEDPRLRWPALHAWLVARAGRGDAEAPAFGRLAEHVQVWQRMQSAAADEPERGRSEEVVLAEVMELWHRLDPALDQICGALGAEVVTGQRALADALEAVALGAQSPERDLHRQLYLLFHLLDEPTVPVRRAALAACSRLVMSPDAQAFDRLTRGTLVQRWAAALELHWRVLSDPAATLEAALRVLDKTLPSVLDGAAPRLAREMLLARARLLRRLTGWREGRLTEAVRAYDMALGAPDDDADPIGRARALGEQAGLRRGRRELDPVAQDRQVRALYDEALSLLGSSVVVRARVLADYAVYLAGPLRPGVEDGPHALALVDQAVVLLEALPSAVREHPVVRGDEAEHRVTQGNLRLEVGIEPLPERRAAAIFDYQEALARLGEGEDLLGGLVHLNLACVALGQAGQGPRDELTQRALNELEHAVQQLVPLPVLHARAVAERAMLAVRAAPDPAPVRERSIRELEAALQRLPAGGDRVVRGRVEQQRGQLYLHREGVDRSQSDDRTRAAECFAAARGAFVEGGAVRLAVEAARGFAEVQLRLHDEQGDPAGLTRGAVVLEQAALLAEQRWAARRPGESTEELLATLDGVFGDLAWFQAQQGRPAPIVLHTVTRAKRHWAGLSMRVLQGRAESASLLSPVYFDPLARRLRAPPPVPDKKAGRPMSAEQLRSRVEAFAAANPEALAVDLTVTRWGTVVVIVDSEGPIYGTVPLSRATVRRWVWGGPDAPGWWSHYLAYREALAAGREPQAHEHEQAWRSAGAELALALGHDLLVPVATALDRSLAGRVVIVAAGPLSGVPLAAAPMGEGKVLAGHAKGLAQVASLARLPAGPLPAPRPDRALCVLADPEGPVDDPVKAPGEEPAMVDELADVVRLLASARAEVEVLAIRGDRHGEAVFQPSAKTQARTTVGEQPTVDAVLDRVSRVDHLFYGGHGRADGLMLVGGGGQPVPLHAEVIRQGPRWSPGSSVLVSAATRHPPPTDDASLWAQLDALGQAGVGFVVVAGSALPREVAREFTRGFYVYWALGRSIPEACVAALAGVAGTDPSRFGDFMVWLGPGELGAPK